MTPPRTRRELQMMRLSAHIRSKPQWFVKMNDTGIVAEWTREAAEQGLTEAQIRYVLAELARPGHRKILAFFLVDPTERIVSTSDIPPQQPWSPTSTMTRAEAEIYREELMRERKFFVDAQNEEMYEREFSLCEH